MKKIALILILFFVSACDSQVKIEQAVKQTVLAIPTQTALLTLAPWPTYTPYPTPTPTKTLTPTPKPTKPLIPPTETSTPKSPWNMTVEELQATNSPLIVDHQPGIYLVMVDILPGYWRSQLQGNAKCYWEIVDKAGNIIVNHYGLSGGTMVIVPPLKNDSSDPYQVTLGPNCGTWKFLYFSPP
jgi:hypothetical protein